jgi:hypothetical protein
MTSFGRAQGMGICTASFMRLFWQLHVDLLTLRFESGSLDTTVHCFSRLCYTLNAFSWTFKQREEFCHLWGCGFRFDLHHLADFTAALLSICQLSEDRGLRTDFAN